MKITAILCNYNGGAYLEESISSVLSQSREADEFILVDDGSTDGSRETIRRLIATKERARLIEHTNNQGQCAGFNTSIEAATGDWLCFIDSDDLWKPGKLEAIESAITASIDAVLIQHPLEVFNASGPTGATVPLITGFGNLWEAWNKTIYFPTFTPTTGLAIRADVAKRVLPVPPNLRHSADSYLTRSCIAHGRVHAITEALGGYRQHDQNAVLGKVGHDSWAFLLKEVAPHLDAYYTRLGIPSPIRKLIEERKPRSLAGKLMDASPRQCIQGLRRFMGSKE